jgi:hypothetical protein
VGLDLVVEGCAKPGHEAEWRRTVEDAFDERELSQAEVARFRDISIPGHERIGAPRVGFDAAADAWIIEARKAETPEQIAETLKEFRGYYVLRLLESDGVPAYSNGGLYGGADETSFRGAFLKSCQGVLGKKLLNEAWEHKWPEDAVSYGQALLAAADAAETAPLQPRPSFFARIGLVRAPEPLPMAEQLDIVRTAGRWFIFWGERGHPIRAWY